MIRVGLIGCGAIGSSLAKAIDQNYAAVAKIVALADAQRQAAQTLQRQLASRPSIVSLPQLIRRSDLVIEAASASVVAQAVRLALSAGRDVLVMSTGGLLTHRSSWQRLAQRSRGRLVVPSGALAGIDGLKAMAVGTIQRIRLTTRKPPKALASAPFVQAKRLNLRRLRRPTTLLEGPPHQILKAFPQNTNVAATVALASELGIFSSPAKRRVSTTVRVVADPTIRVNRHE